MLLLLLWSGGAGEEGQYQKCTVLTPMGLFHAFWNHDSFGAPLVPPAPPVPVPASELCQRRPAERRKAGVKNWERKAGREARKRVDDGVAIVFGGGVVCVVTFFVESVGGGDSEMELKMTTTTGGG